MSTPIPSLNELTPYYNRVDLLNKVVSQIQKDFNWFSLEITFKGDQQSAYQELFDQILPLVDELMHEDYGKLQSLLYRIDIDDNLLSRKLKEYGQVDTHELITDLILKRELQKVIIREIYSQ